MKKRILILALLCALVIPIISAQASTPYRTFTLGVNKDLVEGLYLGLQGVQQYDQGFVLFTGEYGFGNIARGTIPARSALVYQYLIEEIFDD